MKHSKKLDATIKYLLNSDLSAADKVIALTLLIKINSPQVMYNPHFVAFVRDNADAVHNHFNR